MRVAVALLSSALLVAGAAPALAGDSDHPSERLSACDSLGERPTQDQIHACVAAAERFAADHRAMIDKVRVEIQAHRADIDAAAQAVHDNADVIREAEQEVRASMDDLRGAMRELRESERYLGDVPEPPPPPDAPPPPSAPPSPK
jgi:hypothetical protein